MQQPNMDQSDQRDALEYLRELLECAELSQDELEPATAELIDKVRCFLIGKP